MTGIGTPTAASSTGPASGAEPRITVGIATFRRPADLRLALRSVFEQFAGTDGSPQTAGDLDVLIVDNDPDGSGAAVVAEFGLVNARYCREDRRGVAAVRNRLVDECADRDVLVFLDDDEHPRPGWLDALVTTWRRTGAAAVCGPVVPEFEGLIDPWVAAGRFFDRFNRPTGTVVQVAAAGNLLLDLAQIRASGVRFEDRFGLSGGEDNLFSRMLVNSGGTIVWCEESVAVDRVPASRVTRRWVLTRSFSHGNTAGLVDLELRATGQSALAMRVTMALRGAVRVVAGGARLVIGWAFLSRRHQARGARTAMRGLGLMAAAAGLIFREYSRGGRRIAIHRSVPGGSGL